MSEGECRFGGATEAVYCTKHNDADAGLCTVGADALRAQAEVWRTDAVLWQDKAEALREKVAELEAQHITDVNTSISYRKLYDQTEEAAAQLEGERAQAEARLAEAARQISTLQEMEHIHWKRAMSLQSLLTTRDAQMGALREAAERLVRRLREVHDHPTYKAVFAVAHIHGIHYQGPEYTFEVKALEEVIPASGGREEEKP